MPPALLLAGGLGTRLRPITDRIPKCLVPIAGRPLLDYWQAHFVRAGVPEVIINVHAHPQAVRAWVEARNAEGPVRWSVFEEPELLGSGGTLRENLARLEQAADFLVLYADNVSSIDLSAFVRAHRERGAQLTMALFEAPDPRACGIATLSADARIERFVEKPEEPESSLANAGAYAVSKGVLARHLGPGFLDLGFDVLPRLAGRMHGWVIRGYHRDVGTPQALEQIEADVAAGVLERGT